MKKILCTALAACILLGGVLALPAFAETPAAIPADHEPRVLNELSGNAAFMRNLKAMLTKTATPFRVKSAKTKSPADAVGAAPAEGAVATLRALHLLPPFRSAGQCGRPCVFHRDQRFGRRP